MRKSRLLGEKISNGAILASIGAVIVFILLAAVSGIIERSINVCSPEREVRSLPLAHSTSTVLLEHSVVLA